MRGGDAGGGPDYGAKAVLRVVQAGTVATGATNTVIGSVTVPATEDWMITDWDAFAVGAGSLAAVLTLMAGAAAVQTGTTLTLSAGADVAAKFTPGSGEDEGVLVGGGTVLAVMAATGNTTAPSEITAHITGYRRYPTGFKAI